MPIIMTDSVRVETVLTTWFRECKPKILVVTDDRLNFVETEAFGLTEFVATLRASTVHGMTPRVITAQFNPDPALVPSHDPVTDHISNYKFTHSLYGVSKSHYDVVFMLAYHGQHGHPLLTDEAGALHAVTAFMQAGGGLFATGDHEDIGAGMCMAVPRVRSMRLWTDGTPSAAGPDRLSTVLPGSNDVYEFSDQSDPVPQRLFVNFLTQAGGSVSAQLQKFAHPLLQVPGSGRAIEVFPDHGNEGECIIPAHLATTLAGGEKEWPVDTAGSGPVVPEMVALTMSHGNGVTTQFGNWQAVVPRSFIAIAAYDGQRCNVGRVVTDSTLHHFVNANIQPGQAQIAGRNLSDIKQYYTNLATWLMPKNVRRCRRFPWLIRELLRDRLFEEFPPVSAHGLEGARAHQLGSLVESALLGRYSRGDVEALLNDALEDGLGPVARRELEALGAEFGSVSARDAARAALGALTVATAERFNALAGEDNLDGEKAFAETAKASAAGVKLYLASARSKLGKLAGLLDSIAG